MPAGSELRLAALAQDGDQEARSGGYQSAERNHRSGRKAEHPDLLQIWIIWTLQTGSCWGSARYAIKIKRSSVSEQQIV